MMVFLALLPGVFVGWCWAKASGLGSEGQYDACRMWLGVRGDRIPPLVGRVAHRERSERCDGWGIAHGSARTSHLLKQPPTRPAFGRPPSPRGGGISKKAYADAVVTPPSTTMVWPVMKLEASEPR